MATAYPSPPASPRRLDDLLICPVCLEGFKDPKTLVCLHSFCTACLEHCRRPYRRDISCPVCKKVTPLSPLGVSGLQHDFRIQQIKDILLNAGPDPTTGQGETEADVNNKVCDLCKTHQVVSPAFHHCIQCYMYFCNGCLDKHSGNPLFTSHHVINMGESNATEVLFCRTHKEHPVRYFCKPCSLMLCTICTMDHEPTHTPEPLEKGIITKYHSELKGSLRAIKSKLSEVKNKTKYLETIKEAHQKALYDAQTAIREKTEVIVDKIRKQEKELLQEVQNKIDLRMKEKGIDSLTEIKFYSSNIQNLYTEIQSVISGSPQQCLVAYEDLIAKTKSLPEAPQVHSAQRSKDSVLKFVPASDEALNVVIGTLQECTLNDEQEETLTNCNSCPSSPKGGTSSPTSPTPNRKRTSSILNALSPGRKNDVKLGKIKAFSSTEIKEPKSPRSKINADEVLRRTPESKCRSKSPKSSVISKRVRPVSPQQSSPSCSSSAQASLASLEGPPLQISASFATSNKPRLVFKNDQVGGWPGKVTTPSSVAILQDGCLVVAECENRIQIFDRNGQSVRIMGWGKVKPQRVAVVNDGRIAITDRNDNCVKLFGVDGELVSSWGAGMFEMPTGIAIASSGNFIITDIERHTVSIHRPDGSVISSFGSWGAGDYQFNSPAYVAVDRDDSILVSDSCNSCIKIFDKTGAFQRKISMLSGKQAQVRNPMGIAVANNGNILVADRDNHRITMFTAAGQFVQHILTKSDGIRYPVDVRVTDDDHVAVVETHSGFLTKDPHHAVKLYKFS